jgi:hypothetical protein
MTRLTSLTINMAIQMTIGYVKHIHSRRENFLTLAFVARSLLARRRCKISRVLTTIFLTWVVEERSAARLGVRRYQSIAALPGPTRQVAQPPGHEWHITPVVVGVKRTRTTMMAIIVTEINRQD